MTVAWLTPCSLPPPTFSAALMIGDGDAHGSVFGQALPGCSCHPGPLRHQHFQACLYVSECLASRADGCGGGAARINAGCERC